VRFSDNEGRVYVRQSYLNDLILCPERARLGVVRKDMRVGSDATIMGTAVHSAIELVLGAGVNRDDMVAHGLEKFAELRETTQWRETNIDPDKYEVFIDSMCGSWYDEIMPEVEFGGHIEMPFKFPLGMTVGNWAVWCEGTMDYVDPNGVVWDWKTASRSYNALEKQRTSIQATVYSSAIVELGMKEDFPVTFRYGVMIRQAKPRAQIVTVHRTNSHYRWLQHSVSPAIQSSILIGEDNRWMTNDSHHLCSERWCSFWSICKGAYMSPSDMSLPIVDMPLDSVE